MKDKILFLDIDGVINNHASATFHRKINKRDENAFDETKEDVLSWLSGDFSSDALANLYYIVEETKCKIVISSTWRLGATLEEMKSWFKGIPLIQEAIIDKTKSIKVKSDNAYHNVPRGLECKIWLDDNGYNYYRDENLYCIVDDDSDMWPLEHRFVQTNSYDGLTFKKSRKIVNMLSEGLKNE